MTSKDLSDENLHFAMALLRRGLVDEIQFARLMKESSRQQGFRIESHCVEKGILEDSIVSEIKSDIKSGFLDQAPRPQADQDTRSKYDLTVASHKDLGADKKSRVATAKNQKEGAADEGDLPNDAAEDLSLIDELLDEFEELHLKQNPVGIEEILKKLPNDSSDFALKHLIALDVHYRITKNGEKVEAGIYRQFGAEAEKFATAEILKLRDPEMTVPPSNPSSEDLPTVLPSNPSDPPGRLTATDPGGNSATRPGLDDEYLEVHDRPAYRFSVIKHHASGGLGHVSIAKDHELDRNVALKEMRSRYAEDEDARTRFELEAIITGGLEHPGVVPVYGFGKMRDGSPYFAMRFIEGETLGDAAKKYHKSSESATISERRLAFRNLLGRFVDSCYAIGFAHTRGIIHRDIKPSNIMLGRFGETLVVDWGLAKKVARDEQFAGDEASLALRGSLLSGTMDGSTVGTPSYMSPEQAAGKLNEMRPTSDIHSLGSTLYFILTGKVPFPGSDAIEIIMAASENRFKPPREILGTVPPALNSICCKAMEQAQADRYPTALALAEDIEKWLAEEPVSVHKETFFERTKRWIRNHQTLAASTAALIATAAIASIIGVVFVNAEKNRTIAAKEKTEQVNGQLDEAVDHIGDTLNWIMDDVAELQYESSEQKLELTNQDRAFFTGLIDQVEKFTEISGNSEEAKSIRAGGLFRVANLQQKLGDLDSAAEALSKAEETWASLVSTTESNSAYQAELAKVKTSKGILFAQKGKFDEAIEIEGQAISLLDSLGLDDALNHAQELARVLVNRGNTYQKVSKLTEAEKDYQRAIGLYEKIAESNRDEKLQIESAMSRSSLGVFYSQDPKRLEESAVEFAKAIEILKPIVDGKELNGYDALRQLAFEQQNLAFVKSKLGKSDEALKLYQSAKETQVGLVDEYPGIAKFRRDLARSRAGLGRTLLGLKKKGGDAELIEAATLAETLVEDFPDQINFKEELATILQDLAKLYRGSNPEKAKQSYGRALELRKEIGSQNSDNLVAIGQTIRAEINFANFLRSTGELEAAIDQLTSAEKRLASQKKPAASLVNAVQHLLGETYRMLNQYEKSLGYWEKLTENRKHPRWASYENLRAICTVRTGEIDKGVAIALALHESKGDIPVVCYDCCCCYAVAALMETDDAKKAKFIERALDLLEEAGTKKFFETPGAKAYASTDKDLKALRDSERFKELCEKFGVPLEKSDF